MPMIGLKREEYPPHHLPWRGAIHTRSVHDLWRQGAQAGKEQ